jgi:hypothetical protein
MILRRRLNRQSSPSMIGSIDLDPCLPNNRSVRSISDLIWAANSPGVLPTAVNRTPRGVLAFAAGQQTPPSGASRVGGVQAGATRPITSSVSWPARPLSAMVGTSGASSPLPLGARLPKQSKHEEKPTDECGGSVARKCPQSGRYPHGRVTKHVMAAVERGWLAVFERGLFATRDLSERAIGALCRAAPARFAPRRYDWRVITRTNDLARPTPGQRPTSRPSTK